MKQYHIAVVEDEEIFARQLEEYIRRYEKEHAMRIRISFFADGEDIIEDYKANYDIILMDIQMQFMDGMTTAKKIRQQDQEVIIMFITNMIQYAVRGYEVDAMDYVVKPVEYFAFSQKIDKALSRVKKAEAVYFSVTTEEGIQKLASSDIYYIESQGHYAVYHTARGNFSSRNVLRDLEGKMGEYGFFRCSKGYLVNMSLVEGMSGGDCILKGDRIPVSRNKKKEFLELLMDSMKA